MNYIVQRDRVLSRKTYFYAAIVYGKRLQERCRRWAGLLQAAYKAPESHPDGSGQVFTPTLT